MLQEKGRKTTMVNKKRKKDVRIMVPAFFDCSQNYTKYKPGPFVGQLSFR